jgi:MFS family permease
MAGLLYVWRNVVQVLSSYPVGVLGDRFGTQRVLVAGYALGVLTALLAALAFWLNMAALAALALIFMIAGLYVAVQETLESSATADMVSQDTLAISYGALGVVNGTTKFFSSALVGAVWTFVSPAAGFGLAALLMLAGTLALAQVRALQR